MNTTSNTNPIITKILRMSIITSVCATLITPMILASSLYFPYITGKAFFMRIFILIAATLYTVLAVYDKTYRPRVSKLMYAVLGFGLVLVASWLNSVSPDRSFWSNFERMEGLVTLLYMVTLFVVSAATIKKREWSWVLNFSLIISVIVGLTAMGDFSKGGVVRLSGTLGNSSYLGVYALIHVFLALLALLMIYRGNREAELLTSGQHDSATKLKTSSYMYMLVYGLLAVFNTYILFNTGTRGSFIGLVGGLMITSAFLAWKEKNKILRFGAIGVLAAVLISVVALGALKKTSFVTDSPLLSRFAALITTDIRGVFEKQGEARTILWGMAYEGVKERPLLGWGQDTFGYVFAKQYDAGMYAQEQWFDRSHNVFMDWLISAGVLGLLAYLSLFFFAMYCILNKKSHMTVIEKSITLGLLVAYFVHNLFVFDNLSSYVLFFLILAYIHDRYTHDRVSHINELSAHKVTSKKTDDDLDAGSVLIGAAFFALILASYVGYKTIYQPYTQNTALIQSMMLAQDQGKVTLEMLTRMKKVPLDVALDNFNRIFTLGHTGETEAFEQLSNVALQSLSQNTVSEKTKADFVKLYESRIAYHSEKSAGDPRYAYFAANFYDKIGNTDKAYAYAKKAYDLSSDKQSFAYQVAILELKKSNTAGALALLKKAYEDAPKNADAFNYYVTVLLEDAKISGGASYSAIKLGTLATVLADGYAKQGHDLMLKAALWDTFTKSGKKGEGKVLAARLGELVPEKAGELMEFVK